MPTNQELNLIEAGLRYLARASGELKNVVDNFDDLEPASRRACLMNAFLALGHAVHCVAQAIDRDGDDV